MNGHKVLPLRLGVGVIVLNDKNKVSKSKNVSKKSGLENKKAKSSGTKRLPH